MLQYILRFVYVNVCFVTKKSLPTVSLSESDNRSASVFPLVNHWLCCSVSQLPMVDDFVNFLILHQRWLLYPHPDAFSPIISPRTTSTPPRARVANIFEAISQICQLLLSGSERLPNNCERPQLLKLVNLQ
jgi:hypothetical protein